MGKGYYVSFKVAICLGLAVIVVIVAVGLVVGLVTEKVQSDQKSDITTRAPIKSSTFKASSEPFTSQASSEPFTSQASSEPFTSQASSEPFTSQASSEPFTSQASSEPFTSQASSEPFTSQASSEPFTSRASSEPSTQNIPDTTPSQDQFSYRLPNNVIPIHYELELQPFLDLNDDAYNFSGKVKIFMQCTNSTSTLLVHSHKLQYDGPISLTDDEEQTLNVTPGFDTKHQYLTLDVNLTAGKSYTFAANFRGNLTNDLAGFYRILQWIIVQVMATSQMEPADARKAFPCFDEPAMKATFNVTLIHNCDRVPLSNMPNISTTSIDEKWCKTKFSQTPPMSTYLMAFIVSDFTCKNHECFAFFFQVRVFARKSEIDTGRAEYALNVSKTVLNYFGDLFDYPYFLPKSDQIGIPDFAAGAMENWGLVTYRETALLYDEIDSSESNKERVVSVIAHELTHQWFGDLVTIGWWSELWLNEGFATYFSYLGTDAVETTWNFVRNFTQCGTNSSLTLTHNNITESPPICLRWVGSRPFDLASCHANAFKSLGIDHLWGSKKHLHKFQVKTPPSMVLCNWLRVVVFPHGGKLVVIRSRVCSSRQNKDYKFSRPNVNRMLFMVNLCGIKGVFLGVFFYYFGPKVKVRFQKVSLFVTYSFYNKLVFGKRLPKLGCINTK
uniref:Aminopeptidase n=1 Tax=Eptatretus burgeri TaxID=7764 RepID=A0A8C4QNE0_EPTBU